MTGAPRVEAMGGLLGGSVRVANRSTRRSVGRHQGGVGGTGAGEGFTWNIAMSVRRGASWSVLSIARGDARATGRGRPAGSLDRVPAGRLLGIPSAGVRPRMIPALVDEPAAPPSPGREPGREALRGGCTCAGFRNLGSRTTRASSAARPSPPVPRNARALPACVAGQGRENAWPGVVHALPRGRLKARSPDVPRGTSIPD